MIISVKVKVNVWFYYSQITRHGYILYLEIDCKFARLPGLTEIAVGQSNNNRWSTCLKFLVPLSLSAENTLQRYITLSLQIIYVNSVTHCIVVSIIVVQKIL